MSSLKKRIQRGDFDGNSSDEDEKAMIQMMLISSCQQLQTSNHQQGGHAGSTTGRTFIQRDRVAANERIIRNYFCTNSVFNDKMFRQLFRMTKPLFARILSELQQHDNYFVQKCDATGAISLSRIQKMTASLRMLAYGTPADSIDEYVRIGKSTAIESFKKFCRGVVEIFRSEYLRTLNTTDIARLKYDLHIASSCSA